MAEASDAYSFRCSIPLFFQQFQRNQEIQCEIRSKFCNSCQMGYLLHPAAESGAVNVQLICGVCHIHAAVQICSQSRDQFGPFLYVPVPEKPYSRMQQLPGGKVFRHGFQTVAQPVILELIVPEGIVGAGPQAQSRLCFQSRAVDK